VSEMSTSANYRGKHREGSQRQRQYYISKLSRGLNFCPFFLKAGVSSSVPQPAKLFLSQCVKEPRMARLLQGAMKLSVAEIKEEVHEPISPFPCPGC
jgi:hypothetical protein